MLGIIFTLCISGSNDFTKPSQVKSWVLQTQNKKQAPWKEAQQKRKTSYHPKYFGAHGDKV